MRRDVVGRSGLRLAVEVWDGGSPTVVAVHGLGHAAAAWAPTVRRLAGAHRVVAPDLRGHGRSEHSATGDYALGSLALDVEDVIEACAADDDLVLLGHSLGGNVVAHMVRRPPRRCIAVVVVEAGPLLSPAAIARLNTVLRTVGHPAGTFEAYTARLHESLPLADDRDLRELAAVLTHSRDDGTVRDTLDPAAAAWWSGGVPGALNDAAHQVATALAARTVPVTLVRGASSAVVTRPAAAALLDDGLVDDVVEAPRATHAVILDNPGVVVDVIAETTRRHRR